MPRVILFLCTGNYYRSRFAEYLFNHLAREQGMDYIATSRALALELGIFNVGALSKHTRSALQQRGIQLQEPVRQPIQCDEADLQNAFKVIAVKEAEHRPMLTERYPNWPDRVEYWDIHDLDQSTPTEALLQIEERVRKLVDSLK